MRVLVFGDSITQGYWDTEGGWVDRLRKSYDERQVQDLQERDEPTIFNLGISADNTKNILNRIEAETIARTRHGILPIAIVQIGVNDSSTDNGPVQVALDEYKQNLETIIEKMQLLSSKLIFVGLSGCDEAKTTPVVWGNYHYTNEAIKTYEETMAAVAREHDTLYIPVFDAFMQQVKSGANLLPDGLHPNNEGHQLIFEIVRPQLIKLLV
ncbi:MAG TPA: GDSL-type esterase/lipase family protein [Candidatus Saccharimonadales bacterium]|nr:GDSL-type esterase/lipase family protein [Candidatus Saccharimonadales bacterium]